MLCFAFWWYFCNKFSLTVCDDSSIQGRFNDGDIQARVSLISQNIFDNQLLYILPSI